MKCPKCNTQNPTDSKFCMECGAPLVPSDDVTITKTLQTLPAPPGKTIAGKYKILSELGRGGMGVVNKAKDTRLKRTVALKFLPGELIKDKEAKTRFLQEAQAAAALNHPQICTIYEVDEAEDQTFIAMEFIEGQSLKDKLKEGSLDIDEAKDIAVQVAEGLKEAHEKGIVHRDIKPANIMLTKKGQAKITDFGLAKLSWGVDLTKTSTIVGTVAYMSPEQAKGEEIDHRTDIWALGAMLYEMLTGERPFKKSQEHALIYEILNEDPPSVASLRPDILGHIAKVVKKALSKKLSERYQSVNELIQDLKHPPSISLERAEKSIAVLPFEDMSSAKDQEYFCDGISEEIINRLTQIKDFRVIARTSAFAFKGKQEDIREIGRKLDVSTVLEGSVRKSGQRIRITAQLINVTDSSHLWSRSFDREMEDIFTIQDEISIAIADEFKSQVQGETHKLAPTQPTENIQAYNLYLKGLYFKNMLSAEGTNKSISYFSEAIEKDKKFSLAYSALAESHINLCIYLGVNPSKDSLPKAKDAAQRAVELDPLSAEAYTSLALVATFYDWNRNEAEQSFLKAIKLNPNNSNTLLWYANYLMVLEHKFEEALEQLKIAEMLDPLDFRIATYFQFLYVILGDSDRAIKAINKITELDPKNPWVPHSLGHVYIQKKMYKEAITEFEKAIESGDRSMDAVSELATAHALAGNREKSLEYLDELKKRAQRATGVAGFIAINYLSLGEVDTAFEWIERAYDEHDPTLLWLIALPYEWSLSFRQDPRSGLLLEKMGLSHLAIKIKTKKNSVSPQMYSHKYEKSIVVLPFADVSPGKDNEYFSDGLTEEIISDLSKIQSMRVISRTSAMRLKGTDKSMQTIARELDVQYVLEGSVRKAENNLRITAQLIDASNDAHLWSEKYSGTLDDIFDIQEKVSRSIVDALKVKLSPNESRKISEKSITNVQAFEYHLRAKQEIYKFTEHSLNKAIDYLTKALEIEGGNSLLYAALAHTYYHFWNFGIRIDEQDLKQANIYIQKAFALNPDSPDGHFVCGMLEMAGGNVLAAVSHFKKVLSVEPNHFNALAWLAHIYAFFGKTTLVEPLIEKLSRIDPHHDFVWGMRAIQQIYVGQFESSVEKLSDAYQLDKQNFFAKWWYGFSLLYAGQSDEAFAIITKLSKSREDQLTKLLIVLKYAIQNKKSEVLELMSPELKLWAEKNINYSLLLADSYSLINEKEEALNWIEITVKRGNINYPYLSKHDPFLENIRSEPRFKKLMERVKKEWENFEV